MCLLHGGAQEKSETSSDCFSYVFVMSERVLSDWMQVQSCKTILFINTKHTHFFIETFKKNMKFSGNDCCVVLKQYTESEMSN
jgi:hypothetical protein